MPRQTLDSVLMDYDFGAEVKDTSPWQEFGPDGRNGTLFSCAVYLENGTEESERVMFVVRIGPKGNVLDYWVGG